MSVAPSEGAILAGPLGATAPRVDGTECVARAECPRRFEVRANLLRHCPMLLRNPQRRGRGHRHEGSGIQLPGNAGETQERTKKRFATCKGSGNNPSN